MKEGAEATDKILFDGRGKKLLKQAGTEASAFGDVVREGEIPLTGGENSRNNSVRVFVA